MMFMVWFLILALTNSQQESFPQPLFNLELEQGRYSQSRRLYNTSAPLFEGIGTHYSFIWVGTPPQRVSVIMDTGSHHTAFPCVGCNCGKRMDPFFDPAKSTSSVTKKCGINSGKCFFRQSYSEGSSWHAFKVVDKVYIGGQNRKDLVEAANMSLQFEFGCQESETGLFRTQNVGGIMGLSAAEETLPFQLQKHKLAATKMFSLCFRIGGGVMALGGVDDSLHYYTPLGEKETKPVPSTVQFVRLTKKRGWFTVSVVDILMYNPSDKSTTTVGGSIFKCNAGRGTIVDSGTTDTYLPTSLHGNFAKLFRAITGLKYKNEVIQLSKHQYAKLPVIIYRLESVVLGQSVDILVHPTSYMEKQGQDRYVPRVYLTEAVGAVLGANFMDRNNVIFDIDNMRVGFAKSDCIHSTSK